MPDKKPSKRNAKKPNDKKDPKERVVTVKADDKEIKTDEKRKTGK